MDIKSIENDIINDYKDIQNYLQGDPGAEGFINSLTNLEENFANYLIEVLKTKYGENAYKESNIYKTHIKGSSKYIDSKVLEHIISKKVLGKNISIDSLLNQSVERIKELFDTEKSFETALNDGTIQCIFLNDVILQPDTLPTQTTGNDKGVEKKGLTQNKLLLFIFILRELGIYDDDLLFYYGKVDNIVRKSTYYVIFIPRINKTVFLNTGYGEASFICEGEISISEMTSYGKEQLQSELGAKKIIFRENDIGGRKNRLKILLLGKIGKPGKKVDIIPIRNRINKSIIILQKLKEFYDEHKEDTFKDSDGVEIKIKDLFSNTMRYYRSNYKIVNQIFNIKLPNSPDKTYGMAWNKLKTFLGIEEKFETQTNVMTFEELKEFYDEHKEDTFKNSKGNEVKIKDLFIHETYYLKNYKIVNQIFKIKLPSSPDRTYSITWNQFKTKLGIGEIREIPREIISLEELKEFYNKHKEDTFKDSDGVEFKIKDLFSNTMRYYISNYKIVNQIFKTNLPYSIEKIYKISWNQLKIKLGIEESNAMQRKVMQLEELKEFYDEHKEDTFKDSKGNEVKIKDLFRSIPYYRKNYKLVNKKYNTNLPSSPDKKTYGKTFDELRTYLSKE